MTAHETLNRNLLDAAKDGDTEAVESCLAQGADIDFRAGWPGTALLIALRGGHVALAETLIERGANVDVQDGGGLSPLMIVCGETLMETVAGMLLARGADLDAIDDTQGWTALMKAAYYGHADLARRLVEAGADTLIYNEDDTTAQGEAEYKGHADIAGMLEKAEEIRADYLEREACRQRAAEEEASGAESHATAAARQQRLRRHAARFKGLGV